MQRNFKILRFFVLGSVVCFSAVCAQSQEILSINFSTGEGYSDGDLEGQPAGASDIWVNGTAGNLTTRFQVENEQMVLTQNPDDNQWIFLTFPVQTDEFTATFDWQYVGDPANTVDFGFTLSDTFNFNLDGNPDITFNECGTMVRMNVDPDLDVRNGDWEGGGSYETLVPYNYQDGSKISMRIEVDTANLIFDVFATKDGESEVQIADDYGFRRIPSVETEGINSIALWSNGDDEGTQVILDNILISGPAPIAEWSLY